MGKSKITVGVLPSTQPTRSAYCYAVPSASHLDSQLQSMCMVRSPKSITGAVGATLGNAPYGHGVLLRSAFGIALIWDKIYLIIPSNRENSFLAEGGSRSTPCRDGEGLSFCHRYILLHSQHMDACRINSPLQ
ncbi:MAG: hypothetical protein RLZZ580_2514 [Cyanobacteriota bacterium]|jgi:hypothetical protein